MLKRKKRMIIWLSSILLVAVLLIGLKVCCFVDWYEVKLKREIAHLSDEELKSGIRECDTALYRLEKEIDSEETNPEERFEARNAYRSISEDRELYIRELQKREKRKSHRINNSHQ